MKTKLKLLLSAAFAAAVLTGCGGSGESLSSLPAPTIAESVASLTAYVQDLIGGLTSDSGEPRDVNALTLAADDTAEPTGI